MIADKLKTKLLTVLSFSYKKENKLSKLDKLNFVPPLPCLIIACLAGELHSDFNNFHRIRREFTSFGGLHELTLLELIISTLHFCLVSFIFLLSRNAQ